MNVPAFNPEIYVSAEDIPVHLRSFVEPIPGQKLVVFKHPLWCDVLPMATQLPLVDLLHQRQQLLDLYKEIRDWKQFLVLHTRPFRMDALHTLVEERVFTSGQEYWPLAAWVWMDSEQPEHDPRWSRLLDASIPGRRLMTSEEGWRIISGLPEEIAPFKLRTMTPQRNSAFPAGAGVWRAAPQSSSPCGSRARAIDLL